MYFGLKYKSVVERESNSLEVHSVDGRSYSFSGEEASIIQMLIRGVNREQFEAASAEKGLNYFFLEYLQNHDLIFESRERLGFTSWDVCEHLHSYEARLQAVLLFSLFILGSLSLAFLLSSEAINGSILPIESAPLLVGLFLIKLALHEYSHYFVGLINGVGNGRVLFFADGNLGKYVFNASTYKVRPGALSWIWLAGPVCDFVYLSLLTIALTILDLVGDRAIHTLLLVLWATTASNLLFLERSDTRNVMSNILEAKAGALYELLCRSSALIGKVMFGFIVLYLLRAWTQLGTL